MKSAVILLSLIVMNVWAGPATKKIAKPVEKTPSLKTVVEGMPGEKKVEEDCDEKAKKKVEIKPEGLSLLNNSAGCSLDQAQ
ncbi:MAG: hypothetical protein ACOVP4_12655 [Bacteriovoracaceae bacterium]